MPSSHHVLRADVIKQFILPFPELSTFKGFVLHAAANTFAACISHLQYLDPVTIKLLTLGASYNYLLLLLLMGIVLSFLSSFPEHLRRLCCILHWSSIFDPCLFSSLSKMLTKNFLSSWCFCLLWMCRMDIPGENPWQSFGPAESPPSRTALNKSCCGCAPMWSSSVNLMQIPISVIPCWVWALKQ